MMKFSAKIRKTRNELFEHKSFEHNFRKIFFENYEDICNWLVKRTSSKMQSLIGRVYTIPQKYIDFFATAHVPIFLCFAKAFSNVNNKMFLLIFIFIHIFHWLSFLFCFTHHHVLLCNWHRNNTVDWIVL